MPSVPDLLKMEVVGLKQVEDVLRALPRALSEDVLVDGLKAGAREIQRAAQANAADDPALAAAIVVRKANKRQLRAGTGQVIVALASKKLAGGERQAGWRGHFREFGTSPHLIWARGARPEGGKGTPGKALRTALRRINKASRAGVEASGAFSAQSIERARALVTAAGKILGPVVHHPGHRARPFLRPAAASAAPAAVEAVRKRLAVTVLKAAERARRGFARLRGKKLAE